MERAACRRGPRLRPESDERWGYWYIPLLDDQGRPTRMVSERGLVDALATLVAQDVFNLPLPHPWACHRIGRGCTGTDKPRHQPGGVNAGPDESEGAMGTPIEVWGKEYKWALREGTCDETPFEMLSFPFTIWNWHIVTKMACKSCLLASESGKTAGSH
jgi:hypothetical protein